MTLIEKAIFAYEASGLKERDRKNSEASLNKIRHFLALFDIKEVDVNANPFEIDGLRLYVNPLEDVDGVFGQTLKISRPCPRCKVDLTFEVPSEGNAAPLIGQWLSRKHPCEFQPRNPVAGFARQ